MSFFTQIYDRNLRHRIPFLRVGTAADRRSKRYDCYAIASMSMVDRPLSFDGVVDSVSVQGMQFRPSSSHILDRRGEMVSVEINHLPFLGTIVAVRQNGFGIALTTPMTDRELDNIIEEYGLKEEA